MRSAIHRRLQMLREILRLIPKGHRSALPLGLLLVVVNRAAGLVLPASARYLIDDVIGKRDHAMLPVLIGIVLLATAAQAGASFAVAELLNKSGLRIIAALRERIQAHLIRLPVAYFDSSRAGVLVSRIINDADLLRNLLGSGLVEFLGSLLAASFAVSVLIWISPLLTGVTTAFLILFGAIFLVALKRVAPIHKDRSRLTAELCGRVTETINGIRVVKAYRAEDNEIRAFASGVHALLRNGFRQQIVNSFLMLAATCMLGLSGAAVMFVGSHEVFSGALTLGSLATFCAFLAFLVMPVLQVIAVGTSMSDAWAGFSRIQEVMNMSTEDLNPSRVRQMPRIFGSVVFENVTFGYEPDKPVLHNISLQAEPGTVTALVGSSGSGKSTIVNLLAVFYDPQQGAVRVDGIDLNSVTLGSYRSQLGLVLQDTFLFDGTIRENVAFARPGASDEEVRHACGIARIDEFAERFASRLDTIIGERGVKLSGGQRQRVAIARAILASPRILILDEATSSLDSESEYSIQQGFAYLMKNRTTFVIAHRLATIRQANQVLVVEGGNIVERGTHSALLQQRGRYFDLYTRQYGDI